MLFRSTCSWPFSVENPLRVATEALNIHLISCILYLVSVLHNAHQYLHFEYNNIKIKDMSKISLQASLTVRQLLLFTLSILIKQSLRLSQIYLLLSLLQARPGGIFILLKLTCEQGLMRRQETGCCYSLVLSPVLLLLIADTRLASLVEIASEIGPDVAAALMLHSRCPTCELDTPTLMYLLRK